MMRAIRIAIPLLALPLMAAAPQRGLSLEVPADRGSTLPVPAARPAPRRNPLEAAPMPNRDIDGPVAPRASNEPTLAPSLFTRTDTYRGESLGKGSSATIDQDRRARPGAGFNLKMPLVGN